MSFPRYPKYKDSGVEWLGEVPEHWDVIALKRRFRIIGGSTPKSENESFWDGDVLWATPVDLGKTDSLYIRDTQRKITEAGLASCRSTLAPPRSIILSTRAPIGSLAIADVPISTNQGCKTLIPDDRVDSEFFARFLSISATQLNLRGKGTTFLELSGDELSAFPAPFPSPEEQTTIATFLDHETAKIDTLITEQERLIALLAEKRQAVISHAVTKGLDPNVPMKDSGVEWLGEVPEHWEVIKSRRLFSERKEKIRDNDRQLTASQLHGVIYQEDFMTREGHRVVQVIHGSEILKHVEPNDFVISMRSFQGGIEWCGLRGCISSAYVMLIPSNAAKPGFFRYLFKSRSYIQALQATTNLVRDGQALRYANFVLVDLPLAPENEQIAIATFLDHETAKIDTLTTEARRAIDLLKERRSALISAAVTGKIDVRGLVGKEAA